MANIDITKLEDKQLVELIDNRWKSSSPVWDIIDQTYKKNTAIYENKANWLTNIPYIRQQWIVQANRIFVDMEAVINSLIAQPPGVNILPAREGEDAQEFASKLENYFQKKYLDLNIKETMRMGFRNLYFGRLMVIKPFWNPKLGVSGDFDFRAIDPRKVRFGKYARKEQDTEFAIEEIEDNLCAIIDRFPDKKAELMKKHGFSNESDLYIKNPDIQYKEAWINDYVVFKHQEIILAKIKNPYWDWDGILITEEEEQQLGTTTGDARRDLLMNAKLQQEERQAQVATQAQSAQQSGVPPQGAYSTPTDPNSQGQMENPQEEQAPQPPTPEKYKPYMFNYFDNPRKPYIFATVFNNENTPIGRTDMITLASDLQRGIDKRKMDIDQNCEMVNGILKVDASVMGKSDAQRMRFETKGIVWGKGVKNGVTREVGQGLPQMVFEDMQDSRTEIDNIMAASSAFRGERTGQETKAGRLALVQQSYLRLNELVQVGDYVTKEIFEWGMQLAKTRYTEYHYAKWIGKEDASEFIEIIQDDFETGTEVKVIAGKTLPEDDEFKFEQAQNDVKGGYISPIDYLRIAKYNDSERLAKNAFLYKVSPFSQFDISDEERAKIPPPLPASTLRETVAFDELPPAAKVQWLARMGITITEEQVMAEGTTPALTMAFKDLPPDGQVQAAAKIGITLNPEIIIAEKLAEHNKSNVDMGMKIDAQKHEQEMAKKSHDLSALQLTQKDNGNKV